jgi:ATP-dependent Clp protease adaptor protein ClpS
MTPMALSDVETRTVDLAGTDRDHDHPYNVFLWNDPVTPMQIVVLVLKKVFHYDQDKATTLMLAAHRTGKVVVWTGARERAIGYCVQLGTSGLQSTVAKDA